MSLFEDFVKFLNANLPKASSFHPYYEEALGVMLKAGGKHFRALLLLGVVANVDKSLTQKAMRVALGLEMMHTYSLIHDDLPSMDNASLRRGTPTLHVTYDETTAILAGDALNTHAFYEISRAKLPADTRIKCVEILSENAGVSGMVLGQALDCFFENTNKEDIKRAKAKFVIAASLKMGAVIVNLSKTECEKIYDIGLKLGLAFQIQDDIIDLTSDEAAAGKPVHNDLAKNSFTNLLGLSGAKKKKDELICEIEEALKQVDANIAKMILELTDKHLR